MAEFFINPNVTLAAARPTGPAANPRFQLQPRERVFVDLSRRPKTVRIVRAGFSVPAAEVAAEQLEQVLGNLPVQPPAAAPRVVGQSVKAGQKIGAGASVDLVLAPRADIPIRVFKGTHLDLRERSIEVFLEQTLDREEHRSASQVVLSKEDPEDLDDGERVLITRMLEGIDVEIDDSEPGRSFGAFYRALRYTSAYR